MILVSPSGMSMRTLFGPGAVKVGMPDHPFRAFGPVGVWRVSRPSRRCGCGCSSGCAGARVDRGRGCAHEPGVDREPLPGGGLLDAGLERLRWTQVDARHRAVGQVVGVAVFAMAVRRGLVDGLKPDRSRDDDDVGSRPRSRRCAEPGAISRATASNASASTLDDHQPHGGIQRCDQPLGDNPHLLSACLRHREQLPLKTGDEQGKLYPATMAP
jgi:hypothetical protein